MKKRRNPKSKFWKALTPSDKLAVITGPKELTRTDMISKLWKHIKKNKLQMKSNPRMIKTDEALAAICKGKSSVNMFEMTKMAHKHLS